MTKLLAIALALSSCTASAPNKAEIIVLSQAPDAKCDTGITANRKIEVVVCTTGAQSVVGIYSKDFPFQVFRVKTTDEMKVEAEAKAKAPQAPPSGSPMLPEAPK